MEENTYGITETPGADALTVEDSVAAYRNMEPENVGAGIAGAFLFSLLGGLIYFGIYQIGFIAGIVGWVTVVLAMMGYQKFSGKKNSMKGVIVSIIMLVIMILLAEYMCLSFEIFKAFKSEYPISFLDALRATAEFLVDPEVLPEVFRDIVIALALGAVGAFSSIKNALASSRSEKMAVEPPVATIQDEI